MPEKSAHRKVKNRDAGKTGIREYVLPSRRRLDAMSSTGIATEVERGGRPAIRRAISRLKEAMDSGVARKARLRVQHAELTVAEQEMRRRHLGGEVTNLGGTTKKHVPKRRRRPLRGG